MVSASAPSPPKAARTRAAILAAAEACFARQGFDGTRLEDVAERVGIKRASIVYHFRDKRALYEAVVGDLFDGLQAILSEALEREAPHLARIEAAVAGWVDYVGHRPAFAQIMLREVADATSAERPALSHRVAPIARLAKAFLADWKAAGMPRLGDVDPARVASIITGSTVFFVAAMPRLLSEEGFDPLSEAQLAGHRDEILDITWRMLGLEPDRTDDPAQARSTGRPARHRE